MTFSAPKSVSALWAVSSPYERAQIEAAHSRAVAGALARIERDVELVRTRESGELRWERAERLLAAEFVHTSSRLTRDQERGGCAGPAASLPCRGARRRAHGRALRGGGLARAVPLGAGERRVVSRRAGRGPAGARAARSAAGPAGTGATSRWPGCPEELERALVDARRRDRASGARVSRSATAASRAPASSARSRSARGAPRRAAARSNVDEAWRAVGEEYGLTRRAAQGLCSAERRAPRSTADLGRELLADVTKERSTVSERELRARAYELAAGMSHPREADTVVAELARSGELVALEDGRWTTRELREREQQTLELAAGARARARRAGQRGVHPRGAREVATRDRRPAERRAARGAGDDHRRWRRDRAGRAGRDGQGRRAQGGGRSVAARGLSGDRHRGRRRDRRAARRGREAWSAR